MIKIQYFVMGINIFLRIILILVKIIRYILVILLRKIMIIGQIINIIKI